MIVNENNYVVKRTFLLLLWVTVGSTNRCIKFEISGTKYLEHKTLEGRYNKTDSSDCKYRYDHEDPTVSGVLFAYNDRLFDNDHAIGQTPCNMNRSTWYMFVESNGMGKEYGFGEAWRQRGSSFNVSCTACHTITIDQTGSAGFNGVYHEQPGKCNNQPIYYSDSNGLYIFQFTHNLINITHEDVNETAWLVSSTACTFDENEIVAIGTANLMPWESLLWYVKIDGKWDVAMAIYVFCTNCTQQGVHGTSQYPQILGTYFRDSNFTSFCVNRRYVHEDGSHVMVLKDGAELRWQFAKEDVDVCSENFTEFFRSGVLSNVVDPHNVLYWYEYFIGDAFWDNPNLDVQCIEYSKSKMSTVVWVFIGLFCVACIGLVVYLAAAGIISAAITNCDCCKKNNKTVAAADSTHTSNFPSTAYSSF